MRDYAVGSMQAESFLLSLSLIFSFALIVSSTFPLCSPETKDVDFRGPQVGRAPVFTSAPLLGFLTLMFS